MRKFAVLPLLFIPMIAWGDCTDYLQTWAQALHPALELNSDQAVCKVNPGDSSQVLAALPFVDEASEDQSLYGLEVLVADAASGKVIAHWYQPAAIESDAYRFTGLKLDTARYQLAPGQRAFGVRISHEGSSRVNPFGSETLSLYLNDGSRLRQIMNKVVVSDNSGEWDGSCAGDFNETTRTLSLGKPGKNGFVSLRFTEKSVDQHNVVNSDGECDYRTKAPVTATFTLDYDGSQYPVPKGL